MHINHVPPIMNNTQIQQQSVERHSAYTGGLKSDCFCKSVNSDTTGSVKIIKKDFGVTKSGERAELYTLVNKNGASVDISNFGATIVSIKVPDKNGKIVDVLQGYNSVADYDGTPNGHAGGTIGPCANKIGDGKFTLNGKEYQLETNKDGGKTHCHGASVGFDMKPWKAQVIENGVVFTLERPDGEGGYPGNLKAVVSYTFDKDNRLRVNYRAISDADTVLNMTNHAYFNLDGAENTSVNSVYEHIVELPNSTKYTPVGEYALPTGELAEVKGTPMDFTTPKKIGDVIDSDFEQIKKVSGFDHNYCVDGYNGKDLIEVAKVKSDKTGIKLTVASNLPGFQFYTANHLGKSAQTKGRDGSIYEKRSSFCIEPQFYPDAMAKFDEKPILKRGKTYDRTIIYEFDAK